MLPPPPPTMRRKKIPWLPIIMVLGAIGAVIVIGAQYTNQGLHDAAPDAKGANVAGAIMPTDTFKGDLITQPIAFSHKIHAKDNGINCLYCHTYARRSKVAGIPPTSKCMGCHTIIADTKPEIIKLTKMWESRTPPLWKKVNDLPDFVHFSHEKHLRRFLFDNAGQPIERADQVCAMCHGDVKNMTVDVKSKPLTMGFCTRCHEANKGPSSCTACHK